VNGTVQAQNFHCAAQEKKRREKKRLLRDETETGGPADSAGHAMNGGKDG
jgi:hypothetical protein